MMGFLTVPRLAFGAAAVEQLSALGSERTLLVVDPGLRKRGAERRYVEELEKSRARVELCAGPLVDPGVDDLSEGVAVAERLRPDWIVALGGGRTIDTAKGIWVRYERPEVPLDRLTPLVELNLRRNARFVAVPSTSGSGAESSWTASFRRRGDLPLEIASRELVSDWALLDPSLPASMSPEVTASSGAELLARAFEAIGSEWSQPFSDALAIEAVGAGLEHLPAVARHPDDLAARERVHYAATMAGIASANSQVGVAHALALSLASEFDVPFGRLLGVLLPIVLEYNFPSARDRYSKLSGRLGPASVQHRAALPERIRPVLAQLGIPPTLGPAGVPDDLLSERIPRIAERASHAPGAAANPRVPSVNELTRLLELARHGGHVDF